MQKHIDRERALSLQRAMGTRIAAASLHAAGCTPPAGRWPKPLNCSQDGGQCEAL